MLPSTHIPDDWEDFCGNHLQELALLREGSDPRLNLEKAAQFNELLLENASFETLVNIFGENLDQLAYCAVYLFGQDKLTRDQTAMFLEYRSMKKDLKVLDIRPLFMDATNLGTSNIINPELTHFIPFQSELGHFIEEMKHKPQFEQCLFVIEIPQTLKVDKRFRDFLTLAANFRLIKIYPSSNIMIMGCAGVNNEITKALYGEHAKGLFYRLGEFDIKTIEQSVLRKGRYAAIDFPGIEQSKVFHKIDSTPTFMTLHDEFHRRLISTVFNPLYEALLYAVNRIREQTNIIWSREIWDSIDMEVGSFSQMDTKLYLNYAGFGTELVALFFSKLLSENIFTQGVIMGLFTPSPFIDTHWLLLIDMVLNQDAWHARGIDFKILGTDHIYGIHYRFVMANADLLRDESSPARQVALIKSKWLELPSPTAQQEVCFMVNDKAPRYLEVKVDGEALAMSKQEYMNFRTAITIMLQNEKIEIPDMREAVKDLIESAKMEYNLANESKLFMILSNDLSIFKTFFSKISITRVLDQFPEHSNDLLQPLLRSHAWFALVPAYEVPGLIQKFPEHNERIQELIGTKFFRNPTNLFVNKSDTTSNTTSKKPDNSPP